MITQIKFIGRDTFNNLSSVLSIKPDKVIFIYEKDTYSRKYIDNIYMACKIHISNLKYDAYDIASDNLDETYKFIEELTNSLDNCIIDLTDGSNIMIIAGYKVGVEKNIRLIYTDKVNNAIKNILSNEVICNTEKIFLEDYLTANGACILGYSRDMPDENTLNSMYEMSKYIFRNISTWKETCNYIQRSLYENEGLHFRGSRKIVNHQQPIVPDVNLLKYSENQGLIKKLKIGKHIEFSFTSYITKQYLSTFGIWLELFVYMEAHKIKDASEIKLGAMIDWIEDDGIDNIGNEIDVLLNMNSRPICISCKLTEPQISVVNEILVNTKRMSGGMGKGVLVVFGDMDGPNHGVYKRAKELGISVLDKNDIISNNFSERLLKEINSK